MNNPLITVIIPIYNVEDYLEDCIKSVINQTYRNLEIILVDDGSPDNCGKICDEWYEKDNRINVIHKGNGGLSDARNTGIDAAKGEYIFFLDSDDYISYDCIECLYNILIENKADISVTSLKKVYAFEPYVEFKGELFVGSSKKMLFLMYNNFFWEACGKLYNKHLFDNLRFPINLLYEDFYLVPRLFLESNKIVYYNSKKYSYRIRENSITTGQKTHTDLIDIAEQTYEFFKLQEFSVKELSQLFALLKRELNGKRRNSKGNSEFVSRFKLFEKKYHKECFITHSSYRLYALYCVYKSIRKKCF